MPNTGVLILDAERVKAKITRIAHEIHEKHFESGRLILVGIAPMGDEVCRQISAILREVTDLEIENHTLELDKDHPLSRQPTYSGRTGDIIDRRLVLVDDVLNSGRTLIHAVSYLLTFSPLSIGTVVLVDRFHRRYPVRADYVGLTLSSNLREHVTVMRTPDGLEAYLR